MDVLIPLHDILIQLATVFFSTFLAIYTFRLARFFKQGLFYTSYRLLWPAFTSYAMGSFFDAIADLGLGPVWFHVIHAVGYGVFFILITLSVYKFYKAWLQMGMKEV